MTSLACLLEFNHTVCTLNNLSGKLFCIYNRCIWPETLFSEVAAHTKTLVCQVHHPRSRWVKQTMLQENNRTRCRSFRALLPIWYPLQAQHKSIGCHHCMIFTWITFARNQLCLYIKHTKIIFVCVNSTNQYKLSH